MIIRPRRPRRVRMALGDNDASARAAGNGSVTRDSVTHS